MDDRAEAIDILTRMSTNHFYGHREQEALKLGAEALKQRWIPVTEKLPEEDTEVLISYRYKEGEGDTSHIEIDITTYGTMYIGLTKVKDWRPPFEYFYSNYEIIAWMSLPSPYKGGEEE